jgi:hypothetical protein
LSITITEENYLRKRFGIVYDDYSKKVPRFFILFKRTWPYPQRDEIRFEESNSQGIRHDIWFCDYNDEPAGMGKNIR